MSEQRIILLWWRFAGTLSPDLKNRSKKKNTGLDTKTSAPPSPILEKGSAESFWGVFFNLFISLFLAVLGLRCCADFSLVGVSRGYSLVEVFGLVIAVPLLLWLEGSRCMGSVVVAHGLGCSAACGIFPDQGYTSAFTGEFLPLGTREVQVLGFLRHEPPISLHGCAITLFLFNTPKK